MLRLARAPHGGASSATPNTNERHKFAKFLWEACYGKPAQALQIDTAPDVQRTLIVRWMPPDPNDRSNAIEPEPD